jgi:enterochelin esterase-like enzyme
MLPVRFKRVPMRYFLLLAGTVLACAQQPQQAPNVTSPEVLPDHRVIFRIYAPKATSVTVTGDYVTQGLAQAGKLTKDDRGVWSITVGPLPPDLYTYIFDVDGVRTADPKNGTVKTATDTMPGGPIDNLVYIPGPGTEFEDNNQGPHGEVRQVWYYSNALKIMRRLHVYTPPGYDKSTDKYPVFYLIGGGFDNDSAWNSIGRVNFIMDNLINSGKAKPMIVAMPSESVDVPGAPAAQGRGAAPAGGRGAAPAGGRGAASGGRAMSPGLNEQYDTFAEDLLKSVIPFVEGRYRILASQPNRAVAGLSMGAGETLRFAPQNIDVFSHIGVFSMGWHDHINPDFETRNEEKFFKNPEQTNKLVKVLWIGCGKNDNLIGDGDRKLSALLTKRGIKHTFHETEGAHTWIEWRAYLNLFAPLLFK